MHCVCTIGGIYAWSFLPRHFPRHAVQLFAPWLVNPSSPAWLEGGADIYNLVLKESKTKLEVLELRFGWEGLDATLEPAKHN